MAKEAEKKPAGLGIKIPKGAFKKGQESYKSGDPDNVELEPGRYTAIVTGGRGVETKNGPQIVLDIKVPEAGGKVGQFYSLEEDRIRWLFKDLSKLGYEVDTMDEAMLAEILADIKKNKPVVRLSAKQAGEYVNVRIDKLLEDLTAAEVEEGSNNGGEEEVVSEGEEEVVEDKPKPGSVVKKNAGAAAGGKAGKAGKPAREASGGDGEEAAEGGGEGGEEAGEAEEEAGDDLEGLSRIKLKKIISDENLEVKVVRSMSDDDVREAVRAARTASTEGEEEEPAEEEEKPKPALKKTAGKPAPKPAKEEPAEEEVVEEEPAAEETEVELKKGMKVAATLGGKLTKGCVITEILEDEGKVKVKAPDNKIYKISPEKLSL